VLGNLAVHDQGEVNPMADMWTYRENVLADGHDVVGYDVEAIDGDLGKIDESTTEAGQQHVVVDTGFWIFGKKRLIPAGAIMSIDHEKERVMVNMTKDQIKDAPDFDEARRAEAEYRASHEEYYQPYSR
jgi:hypothetical protein